MADSPWQEVNKVFASAETIESLYRLYRDGTGRSPAEAMAMAIETYRLNNAKETDNV